MSRESKWVEALDPSTKMPTNEQDRTAEAVRRKLPELRVLERYAPLRDKTVRSAPSHLGQGLFPGCDTPLRRAMRRGMR